MASTQLSDGLPPVLSTEEVAELLRLNPKTVLAMARDGRLPAHRLPGCRKFQYLASEILATVAAAPGIGETGECSPNGYPPPQATTTEIDPCEVWGPAPTSSDDDRLRRHWLELATKAGLFPVLVTNEQPVVEHQPRSAGLVEVDGLVYEMLVGPRQRTRYVDDDGDFRWGLIDAVWVEPLSKVQAELPGMRANAAQ